MPSSFADEFQDTSDDLDEHFGEPVTVIPQVEDDSSEYFSRGADPSKAERRLTGIFSDDPAVTTVLGSGANTHENNDVAARRTSIDFDIRQFADPAAQPWPAAGWVIRADDEPGLPLYEVVAAQFDGVSRLVVQVFFKGLSPT